MKRIIPFIVLFFCVISIEAQYSIKGVVVDSSTGKGVEYGVIQIEGTNGGCFTDSAGNFALTNLKTEPDSLLFSCVGYQSKKVYKMNRHFPQLQQIILQRKAYELKEVVIRPLKNSQWLGDKKKKTGQSVLLNYASMELRYFTLPQNSSYIKCFEFYLNEISGRNSKVRIHIYNVDITTMLPMDNIIQTNVIMSNLKKGWNTVDLSEQRIAVPTEGFFIGLESVTPKDKCLKEKTYKDQRIVTYLDVVIGCTKEATVTARKSAFFADYEVNGELNVRKGNDKWSIGKGNLKGYDLLYRVEIIY